MQIYLTPPGGEREGPFTLEEINRNLAARKYKDTDYWAWYSGQREWVPLHMVPGVIAGGDTMAWVLDEPAQESEPDSVPSGESEIASAEAGAPLGASGGATKTAAETSANTAPNLLASPPPEPEGTAAALERKLFCGLPFTALEQVFILTTGDGPAASRSAVTLNVMEQTVGEPIVAIRARAQRDVVSHCAFIEQLRTQTALPAAAWAAMANFRTQLVQDARAGLYKVCVRTFPIESGDLACLFLFYNREKL